MWGAIFSGISGLFTGLFGGGSGGGNQALVGKLADKILPQTEQEKAADSIAEADEDIKDVTSARSYQAPDMPVIQYTPGLGIIPFLLLWTLDLIDHAVDTLNHAIRPMYLVYLTLGSMGKIPLPSATTMGPEMWAIYKTVVVFFFGGRMLFKDVPEVIKAIRK